MSAYTQKDGAARKSAENMEAKNDIVHFARGWVASENVMFRSC